MVSLLDPCVEDNECKLRFFSIGLHLSEEKVIQIVVLLHILSVRFFTCSSNGRCFGACTRSKKETDLLT